MGGNRIAVYDGYVKPRTKRQRRRSKRRRLGRTISPAMRAQQSKMKECAAEWQESSKRGTYREFIKRCLRE